MPYGYSFEKFFRLAHNFGPEYEGVVVLALVTIHRRKLEPQGVQNLLERMGDMKLPLWLHRSTEAEHRALGSTCYEWKGVREARQFAKILIMASIHTQSGRRNGALITHFGYSGAGRARRKGIRELEKPSEETLIARHSG